MADDDLLSELASTKGANIADATVEIEDIDMNFDVDELAKNADGEETDLGIDRGVAVARHRRTAKAAAPQSRFFA